MTFDIWEHKQQAFILLPLPGEDKIDTSGSDWVKVHTFEATSLTNAQIEFEEWVDGGRAANRAKRLAWAGTV